MSTAFTRAVFSLGLCCSLATAPAFAQSESRLVRYSDLDLTSSAGKHVLRNRISYAVNAVCGDVDQRDLQAMSAVAACRSAARANAMPQMQLAIANAHGGQAYAANDAKAPPAGR